MRRFRAFIVAFLVATFVISIPARNSIAVMQIPYNTIVYGPLDIGGILGLPVVEGVGVCAHDKYAAAMTALGYGGDVVTGLDSDKKALLSNQSSGGAFWTFSQHFVNPSSSGNLTERMVYRYAELYGSGVVWSAEYMASEKAAASAALKTILDGGTLGGGSGTPGQGEGGYAMSYDLDFYPTTYNRGVRVYEPVFTNGIVTGRGADIGGFSCMDDSTAEGCTVYVPQQQREYIDAQLAMGRKVFMIVSYNGDMWMFSIDGDISYEIRNISSWPRIVFPEGAVIHRTGSRYYMIAVRYAFVSTVKPQYFVGYNRDFTEDVTYSDGQQITGDIFMGVFDSDHPNGNPNPGTPVIPPSNWPDTPDDETPTAPDVPEPSQPDSPSQPAMPTAPDLPDFPSNIISSGTTYDTFDIQAILDAMDEHCQHLQSAIYQGFADYFDTFTPWLDERLDTLQACIRGESVWQIQRIDADFESLKDYLHDLFEWLADQMQFTFTGDSYDDSSVISWLRRIYFKLQSSPVNTRPADPVANPDDSWDWLWQLLQDILNGLTGGATELVGKLMNLFDGIKDKFPFSVPWDLAAVLVLLDVPAQTPAFVISYDVFGTTVTYDIDLHFMDDYAGVIRSMETVLFCFMLIKNTKWLTGIFDEVGQFLGTKLGYRG